MSVQKGLHRRSFNRILLLIGVLLILGCSRAQSIQEQSTNVERGKRFIESYGCTACHAIPGIQGVSGNVGPPLNDMAKRSYIAGVLANTPDNMQRWLRNPPAVDPLTAMPDLGISGAEARDIAAYLYSPS